MQLRRLLDIVLLGLMWAPSFLFIKIGVEDLSPIDLVAGRLALGAIFLLIIAKLRGGKLPRDLQTWKHLAIAGFFACSLPFMLFGFAERTISSALAGITNGSTPLFAALLAHFFSAGERLNLSRSVGIAVGLAGFLALVLPSALHADVHGAGWGVVAVAIASVSYAIGMVYTKTRVPKLPPFVGPASMLFISAAYMLPLASITHPMFAWTHFSWQGAGSVLGLAVFGTAGAFTFYYRVLSHSGAIALSMSVYVMSCVAAVLGYLFLNEMLSWTTYLAAALIIVGIMLTNGTIKLPERESFRTR